MRGESEKTLVISDADSQRLDEICAVHNGAKKQWIGQVLLRFGMRNAAAAIREDADNTAIRLEGKQGRPGF